MITNLVFIASGKDNIFPGVIKDLFSNAVECFLRGGASRLSIGFERNCHIVPRVVIEPPVPDADGDSDSDATVDYREDGLLALAAGDEDVLVLLPPNFKVDPSYILLDGDGFASWLTKQDKVKAGTVTPAMQQKYAKEIRAAKLEEFKSYLDNDAIRLTGRRKLGRDVNFLTGRWVLTVKVDKNGYFSKFKVKDYPYRVSMILRKGTWWIVERAHDLRQESKPCYLEEEAEVLVSLIQLWLRRPKFALGPTPSRSAHRLDLSTGVPEYKAYLESISWAIRCGLRHRGRDNTIVYYGSQTRKFPKDIWPAVIKVKPDSVPLYLGHQTVSAYFPFGETAVTRLIEGQLAFLHHVRNYEDAHPGTRLLKRNLCWKIDFLNCCLGALPAAQLNEIAASIEEIAALKGQPKTMDGQ
ncbi:hypothetical protein AK812_SmicGene35406 [Symbiodinium microadriaticum]|uniref:Uncharacterized protein n=1 Tax=Symbiodinium microadriaticum TaxID=2951 RepID=A0A1Q9CLJ6_SYMMI|nr:hypothetical protein AK812_SmicGene35406 [Symbiodinium microadriaticum]